MITASVLKELTSLRSKVQNHLTYAVHIKRHYLTVLIWLNELFDIFSSWKCEQYIKIQLSAYFRIFFKMLSLNTVAQKILVFC